MMKRFVLIGCLFSAIITSAQSTWLECMQGVWKIYREDNTTVFNINKSFNSLTIGYDANGESISISETVFGFLDYNPNDSGRVHYSDLKPEGSYYVELFPGDMNADSVFRSQYFLTPDYGDCDDEGMYIHAHRYIIESVRLQHLPSRAMRYLYEEGIKDNRNYILEYLEKQAAQVKAEKSIIYSNPETPTKMYLIKGDVITILEEQEGFYRMEYETAKGELITGWVKKEDVSDLR